MANTIAKTATFKGVNSEGSTVELEIPLTNQKATLSNEVNSFARPKPNGGEPERRALNMNRWEYALQINANVTDDFVDQTHNGSGDRPDISNKEEWLNELYKLAVAVEIIEYKAVNDQTKSKVSEWSGYIHNLDFNEKSSKRNSVYEITVKLVDEIPMNS